MLTYALDEYGDFEGIRGTVGPVYIAGLIYDDRGAAGEEELERERIRTYYEAVIADARTAAADAEEARLFSYPEALHSDSNKNRDSRVVRPVKEGVRTTLKEFIQFGTYKGRNLYHTDNTEEKTGDKAENKAQNKEAGETGNKTGDKAVAAAAAKTGKRRVFKKRKGEYHVFVMLKSEQGMKRLLGENSNILAKDSYASNLYFHMADVLISRLIFYNPLIDDIQDIALDIATRRSAELSGDSELFRQYKAQGYIAEKNKRGKFQFRLTNPDVYRSVIAEEILDADRPDLKISRFNVDSIGYHNWDTEGMEFLYMADSICTALGYRINGKGPDNWLDSIIDRAHNLTGRTENLIFGYDEIDHVYSKAWAKCEEGDYYEALSISFDASRIEGAFARHYRKLWFKKLEERIARKADADGFAAAVEKLGISLITNRRDTDKSSYIFHFLETLAPAMEDRFRNREAKRILYKLYDIGVSTSCHMGDSKNAELYFERCRQYADLVSLSDNLGTRNKMVVFCCDYFDMDRAEAISDENIMFQEQVMYLRTKLNLTSEGNPASLALGKAYSQRGQVYAFKRDSRAMGAFEEALAYFEEGSPNYKITLSYLLHHLLDTGNREGYMAWAPGYFGGKKNPMEQLKYIVGEGSRADPMISMEFALYIYVRALYLFYSGRMSERVWTELQKIEEKFGKKKKVQDWKISGHPGELIFKYMMLIADSRGEEELAQLYARRMRKCLKSCGATENVIIDFGEVELLEKKGDTARRDERSMQLCKYMSENFEVFKDMDIPEDGDARYRWLDEHITYMYR